MNECRSQNTSQEAFEIGVEGVVDGLVLGTLLDRHARSKMTTTANSRLFALSPERHARQNRMSSAKITVVLERPGSTSTEI